MLEPLPIDPLLPDIVRSLRANPNLVLRAPTGAGKTTRVPPALLDAGLAADKQIVMLEPRRLAARAAAQRMAQERGQQVGDEIGYQVRFERRAGPRTRILVVTPGILLRRLHDDPFLEAIGILLFDEFHERGLDSDLALGMAQLLQRNVRPDLRLVVMSATLSEGKIAEYLACPVIRSEGKSYPVDIRYESPAATTSPTHGRVPGPHAAAHAVERLLPETPGDMLVFLPGLHEIRQTAHLLEALAERHDLLVLPLHGDLPLEQQDAALLPQPRRKIVLATNVAETSVTVQGITAVVDTGVARALVFDPHVGLDRLKLMPISRASADQRAGRAGRTAPGVCLRLWSEVAHRSRPEEHPPEIQRVDLAGAVLQLWRLGEQRIDAFPWLDPPPAAAVERALVLLRRLGALHGARLTQLGHALAGLPLHPRLGRLLIEGQRLGVLPRAALAAALLSERDPFARSLDEQPTTAAHETTSDVLDRVEALEAFAESGRLDSPRGRLNRNAARFVLRARDQLVRLVEADVRHVDRAPTPPDEDESLLRALLAAFPDRLARRREPHGARGVMVGGRGVRLLPTSGVREPELFLCIDVDAGRAETLVRQASMVRRDWLPSEMVRSELVVLFNAAEEKVEARKRTSFEDLVLEETPAALPDSDQVAAVLAEAAAANLERVLPGDWPYLTRLRCLRAWMPELNLPAGDDDQLRALLPGLCRGRRSFADLRAANWTAALQALLDHRQVQAVEREAPERLQVPSGSRLTLHYEEGRPPVLAVRIQEVFGWKETPRLAGGRVPVLLHLLAPSGRPQQVTEDLASFWANTYPKIYKQLRARYPKHAWPDDPLSAPPRRR